MQAEPASISQPLRSGVRALQWHPTEIAEDRRTSIDAYAANLPNVSKAVFLDATEPGWHTSFGGLDLVILVNLLHLIDMPPKPRR